MKLVLLNVNPQKKFNKEKTSLIKIQIDNCIELGWDVNDIVLATNFPYEYRGVKSTLVADDNYCGIDDSRYAFKVSTHIFVISELLERGLIEKGMLYWYHDIDAYQEVPITEEELGLDGKDLGLTDYGWSTKWNLGSIFFKESAKDIIWLLRDTIANEKIPDERAMRMLVGQGKVDKRRYKKLNITYNFGMRKIPIMWEMAEKPLKVIHFHPMYKDPDMPETTMNIFRYGKNELGIPLMSKRLMKLFDIHGFEYPYGTTASYNAFLKAISYE